MFVLQDIAIFRGVELREANKKFYSLLYWSPEKHFIISLHDIEL